MRTSNGGPVVISDGPFAEVADAARAAFDRAIARTANGPVRAHLERRRTSCT